MSNLTKLYIGGQWVDPVSGGRIGVTNPSTEDYAASIAVGSQADVDAAVNAARKAFGTFSTTTPTYRLELLQKIRSVYERRSDELAEAISLEMGAPITLARTAQTGAGFAHLNTAIDLLETQDDESALGKARILREPIGVVGLITPWNWPLNQIVLKVAPALAAGCTIVLKPSELSPLSAIIFAEILDEAGVPPGVFNLVNGDGETVGQAISAHPDIDMVSFTGSTRAGIAVAKAAADTIKRVSQELGGKSANVVLADADLEPAIRNAVLRAFSNSGQSCAAPTRLFVPEHLKEQVYAIAKDQAEQLKVGAPSDEATNLGPVISKRQFDRIQSYIEIGSEEGARLIAGGPGRPEGLDRGYYVRPTIFGDVQHHHRIAQEEIFGPVLAILPYTDEEVLVEQVNDTVYGLAAYIQTADHAKALELARRFRAGQVSVNYPDYESGAPFGGYKQSGNGREGGIFGFHEFQEVKAVLGIPR